MSDLRKVYDGGAADKVGRDQERQGRFREGEAKVLALVSKLRAAGDIFGRQGVELGFLSSDGGKRQAKCILRKGEDKETCGKACVYWCYGEAWWRGDQYIWEWTLTDDVFEDGWRDRFFLLGGNADGAAAEMVQRLGQGHLFLAPGEPGRLNEVVWGRELSRVITEQEQRVLLNQKRPALPDRRMQREGRTEWRLEKLERKR